MRAPSILSLSVLLAAAAAPSAVLGHGNIMEPAAVWQKGYPDTGYSATISGTLWGPIDGRTYGYGGEGALKYFDANFPKSKYKSLKELILGEQKVESGSAECGFTIKDETKRAKLPSTLVHSAFFHPGPCEVWCDNQKLAYALDCQTAYKDAKIPLDTSKCMGADRLTLYWLAVHGPPWQVYIDCVYLAGSKGSSGAAAAPPAAAPTTRPTTPAATNAPPAPAPAPALTTSAPAATPAVTPKPPTVTPKTPTLTPSAPAVGGEATITPKPAATSKAPAKNCKRNRSRQ